MQKDSPISAAPEKLILWTGEKHSGKTTALANLVRIVRAEGFDVAGILSPSLYRDGRLMGFNVLDLRKGNQATLATRKMGVNTTGSFSFLDEGLRFGNAALSKKATESADLIVIDEFGPLELSGQGWRNSVDSLLTTSNAVTLLVVRRELVDSVTRLYVDFGSREVDSAEPEAPGRVMAIISNRRVARTLPVIND